MSQRAAPHDEPQRDALDPYGAATHAVFNQPSELADTNLFSGDAALQDGVAREGGGWASNELAALGARLGSAETLELGVLANRNPPELDTHDRYGNRVDLVRYHPAYHAADAARRRTGLARFALDRAAPGRACRTRGALLHAGAGRGGPRLPDHHDLRRDAEPAPRSRSSPSTGCRRSTPASTIRATSPRPTSRA